MNNIVTKDVFSIYGQKKKAILVMPYSEDFDLALCDLGYEVYRVNTGEEWNQDISRPDNHYILPLGEIKKCIHYSIFVVPCHKYDPNIVENISQNLNIPTIQVDDIGAIKDGDPVPFGWAKKIETNNPEFKSYWSELIETHIYARLK